LVEGVVCGGFGGGADWVGIYVGGGVGWDEQFYQCAIWAVGSGVAG